MTRKFFETYATTRIAAKGASTFEFPEFPDNSGHSDVIVNMLDGLWVAIDHYVQKAAAIRNDRRFSDHGKNEQITPETILVYRTWLDTAASVAAFDAMTDATEKTLVGAPEPHPQNLVAHFRAAEIRQYWRGLAVPEKAERLKSLNVDDDRELALAMLQSPLPLNAFEDQAFRETWANACREADPVTAQIIALARKSVQWAERCLALALVAIRQTADWSDQRVLGEMIDCINPHYADKDLMRLGYGQDVITQARLRKQNGR